MQICGTDSVTASCAFATPLLLNKGTPPQDLDLDPLYLKGPAAELLRVKLVGLAIPAPALPVRLRRTFEGGITH